MAYILPLEFADMLELIERMGYAEGFTLGFLEGYLETLSEWNAPGIETGNTDLSIGKAAAVRGLVRAGLVTEDIGAAELGMPVERFRSRCL